MMKELMIEHGLKEPDFQVSKDVFKIIFKGPGENIYDLAEKSGKITSLSFLNERQGRILNDFYTKKRNEISTKEYAKIFNISPRHARRDIKELIDNDILAMKREKGKITYHFLDI